MEKMELKTWNYKDGSRMFWTIEAWFSGDFEIQIDEEKDWKWDYQIFREGNESPIYVGSFVGQSDLPPRLDDLLLDWLGYINSVVMGACQHAIEAIEPN